MDVVQLLFVPRSKSSVEAMQSKSCVLTGARGAPQGEGGYGSWSGLAASCGLL